MRLIAILIAFWANQHPQKIDRWRNPTLYLRYLHWLQERLATHFGDKQDLVQLVLALLPPILIFALLQVWLEGWFFGLAEIALGIWALLFLHGPGRPEEQLKDFGEAWREGHIGSARGYAAELSGSSTATASESTLPLLATAGLFWQTYRRLLSGIFWLLLLGPIGPFALRLVVLTHEAVKLRDSRLTDYSERLLGILDWLPARASALSFALAGSFVHARSAWRQAQHESKHASRLVAATAIGALHIDDLAEEIFEAEDDDLEDLLQDAQELVGRSLMVWVAVAALLTIAGWLY